MKRRSIHTSRPRSKLFGGPCLSGQGDGRHDGWKRNLACGGQTLAGRNAQHSKEGSFDPDGEEACKLTGDPPQPLLGIGVYQSVEELLDKVGSGQYRLSRMEVNWAEKTGLWLNGIAPVLLGLGLVGLLSSSRHPAWRFRYAPG